MLEDLEILNGDMPLNFDPLNTIYTINLNTDDDILRFNYRIKDTDDISFYGNSLKEGLNEVVLTVYNDQDMMSYYLYVYKDNTKEVTTINNSKTNLEINNIETLREYSVPIISSVCFLFILLFFTLLFKKNKKNKFY